MKHLLIALAVAVFAASAVSAETKTKEVCKPVMGKDNKPVKNKDGTTKEKCKTIKVHEKKEGTKIPPKK
jgi:hypothetical protein